MRLPRTPPFSRLLRHAGGYSRTILTPNLQGAGSGLEYVGLANNIGQVTRGSREGFYSAAILTVAPLAW